MLLKEAYLGTHLEGTYAFNRYYNLFRGDKGLVTVRCKRELYVYYNGYRHKQPPSVWREEIEKYFLCDGLKLAGTFPNYEVQTKTPLDGHIPARNIIPCPH